MRKQKLQHVKYLCPLCNETIVSDRMLDNRGVIKIGDTTVGGTCDNCFNQSLYNDENKEVVILATWYEGEPEPKAVSLEEANRRGKEVVHFD